MWSRPVRALAVEWSETIVHLNGREAMVLIKRVQEVKTNVDTFHILYSSNTSFFVYLKAPY
jgi:hypothetical protein